MNYSDDLKVVWITPMRTGTRSSNALMKKLNFGGMNHEIKIPDGKESYFVVMNIRNPYSRLVSLYNMFRFSQKNMNYEFETWIKNDHYLLMDNVHDTFLSNRIKKLKTKPSVFIRMENFVEDILSLDFIRDNYELLKEDIEENILKNRYVNDYVPPGSQKKFWKEYYTDELAEMVQYKMKNEFEYLNYNLNSWK